MTDPVSISLGVSALASAAGAGISAYGQRQAGQAQAAMYRYQAGVANTLAGVATQNANWDIASGEVKAQQAGLQSAATVGRIGARAGAGNVAQTGSTGQVIGSQLAIGRENQAVLRADAAHAAYGEQVQAAAKTAEAGADVISAQTAIPAANIAALGSVVGGVGSVASKWYDYSKYQGRSTGYNDSSIAES